MAGHPAIRGGPVAHAPLGPQGETVVTVALTPPDGQVVEEHVVDQFPDGDTEWEQRFLAACEEAERRAFHLNADRPEISC